MKKIFVIAFVLISFVSKAQVYQQYNQYGGRFLRMKDSIALSIPTFCGNPSSVSTYTKDSTAALVYFDSCNHRYWVYDPKLKAWDSLHLGITASGADGNNYPTSLSFNTGDGVLTLARNGLSVLTQDLDGRWLLISDTSNKWVQNAYVRNDSLFILKNGTETFLAVVNGLLYVSAQNSIVGDGTPGDPLQLENDLSDPGIKFFYGTDANSIRNYQPFDFSTLHYKPDLNNWKKDTTNIITFNVADTAQGTSNKFTFVAGSIYDTATAETVVSGGLKLYNHYAGGTLLGDGAFAWKDSFQTAAHNKTIVMTFKVDSIPSTNAYVGLAWRGTNTFLSRTKKLFVSLNVSSSYAITYRSGHGTFILGSGIPMDVGDNVKLTWNNFFNTFTVKLENLTTRRSVEYAITDTSSGAADITTMSPGFLLMNSRIIMSDWHYYVNSYRPDVVLLGSSITQNEWPPRQWSKSYGGQLEARTNMTIVNEGGSASRAVEFIQQLQEIKLLKPKLVIFEAGYNDVYLGTDATTWHNNIRNTVDSLLSYGIKVVVRRVLPSNNGTVSQTVNAWIDSTYSNHPKVMILNDYETTAPIYNTGFTGNADPGYFADGIHPNSFGATVWAAYDATQIERLIHRHNVEAGSDFILTSRKNRQLGIYDSTGVNQGQWNTYKLDPLGFTIHGDTLTPAVTSVDTSNISNFSVKVRSLFSAGVDLTYNNGVFSADTTDGVTKLATQGDIIRALPGIDDVLSRNQYLTADRSIRASNTFALSIDSLNSFELFARPSSGLKGGIQTYFGATQIHYNGGSSNLSVVTLGGTTINLEQYKTGGAQNHINIFADSAASLKKISYEGNIRSSFNQYTLVDKGYADSLHGTVGATPTLQQVFNTEPGGSVLTKTDSVALNGFNLLMYKNSSNAVYFNGANTSHLMDVITGTSQGGIAILSAATSTSPFRVSRVRTNDANIYNNIELYSSHGASGARNGQGGSIDMKLMDNANNERLTARLAWKWSDSASATYTAQVDLLVAHNAALEAYANFQTNGIVRVNNLADTLATRAYARAQALLGLGSGTDGDIKIYNGGWTNLGIGTPNQVLTVIDGFPSWEDPAGGVSTFAALTDVNLTSLATNDFLKWDGTDWINRAPANVRTDLGGTTVGQNIFTLTNPSATGYIRTNADNTVTHRSYVNVKVDLGLDNVENAAASTLYVPIAGTSSVTGKKSFTGGIAITSYASITSGSSSTIGNDITKVVFDPASDLTAYTLTLPATPVDGQEIEIIAGGTIAAGSAVSTSFTLSPNSGQSILTAITPTQLYSGDVMLFTYKSSNTTWYRKK